MFDRLRAACDVDRYDGPSQLSLRSIATARTASTSIDGAQIVRHPPVLAILMMSRISFPLPMLSAVGIGGTVGTL